MAVQLEFEKWGLKVEPRLMTYDGLRKLMLSGYDGPLPQFVCFDESSKLKSQSSQRSQAADILTEKMREAYPVVYIVEMSGSPAPKSPVDWYHQCEVAEPGFIREGTVWKFKERLCLVTMQTGHDGREYPQLKTWFDDERKCKVCGDYQDAHDMVYSDHPWQPSQNEVAHLYTRLNGLVLVKFKKDCLKDLPDKQYRLEHVDRDWETMSCAS